jgi:hypothetical protein
MPATPIAVAREVAILSITEVRGDAAGWGHNEHDHHR